MKSSVEKKSALEIKLNIEVPAAKVEAAFQKAYKGIQKVANIKGFRKGKAPLNMVRDMYGEKVKQDVLQEIVQKHYQMALDEHSLEPVSFPNIDFDSFEESQDFSFSAVFEVRPEVILKKIDGLKVEKEKLNISEDKVDEALENLRSQNPEMAPVFEDRPAADGDIAVIDFVGIVDSQQLDNATANDFPLELGSNQFIPGFEDGVKGMKPGSAHSMNLNFPADYHAQDLAGKPVTFNITLKELKKKTLPDLNDEFAKKVGDFENIDKLKEAIREDIQKSEERRIKEDLKSDILKSLCDNNPVEVPPSLVQKQKEMLLKDIRDRMQQQGVSQEQYEEYVKKWDKDFDKSAVFMVQSSFLIHEIAKQETLVANVQDVTDKLQEYSLSTGIELARLKEFYDKDENLSRLKHQITEEKVVDFLLSKASVKEVDAKPEKS